MAGNTKAAVPRAERIINGVWRLRLPLPWPGVPHGNAWVLAAGDGLVLVDTGVGGEGGLRNFEQALGQLGFAVSGIDLVVCTHAHSDHCGLAGPLTERAGCELWMHPAWEHTKLLADDPEAEFEQRLEVARMSGVPAAGIEKYRAGREPEYVIDDLRAPDRELVPGVVVETDLGPWEVYETPGHAPSHVVLHQPDRRLMLTGDHLLGRTVLYFDQGHTEDPVAEFLESLDRIEPLGVDLCLPGHGRPFRDPKAKVAESRRQVEEMRAQVRAALADGERTAFEVVASFIGEENLDGPMAGYLLQIVLALLANMTSRGEVAVVADADPQRWALA